MSASSMRPSREPGVAAEAVAEKRVARADFVVVVDSRRCFFPCAAGDWAVAAREGPSFVAMAPWCGCPVGLYQSLSFGRGSLLAIPNA